MLIEFYACSECGKVSDLDGEDLAYIQSKQHGFFMSIPATNCTGTFTVPSSKEAWEAQENRQYPQDLLDKDKSEIFSLK